MTVVADVLILLFLLQTKHFISDFLLQTNWQAMNKHNLFHPGGYVHAAITVVSTYVALFIWFVLSDYPFSRQFYHLVLWICAAEFVVHYAIDWSKMNFNRKMKWGPTTHKEFWYLLGLDQFLHQLCYIIMIAVIYGVIDNATINSLTR